MAGEETTDFQKGVKQVFEEDDRQEAGRKSGGLRMPRTGLEWVQATAMAGALAAAGAVGVLSITLSDDSCVDMRKSNPEAFKQAVEGIRALQDADPNLRIDEFSYTHEGDTCLFKQAALKL